MGEKEWRARGKECSPSETVARAKRILSNLGFEYEYEEGVTGLEECFSSRLTLIPPGDGLLGTNGKGMSRELCMASAFGEMMERLSNASLDGLNLYDPEINEIYGDVGRFYSLSAAEQPDCIRELKKKICDSMQEPMIGTKEDILNIILKELTIDGDRIPSYPFYSVRKKKVEYLPLNLIRSFTGSNGMAAGNTVEEAMVEGISEIFERYSQQKIIEGGIHLPKVPDSELSRYPHIQKVIREIEADGTRSVLLLDASLGLGLPVLCGISIHRDSGRIGVKFGAHPKMSVALERIFTEGMQGRSIETFSNMNSVSFQNEYDEKRVDHWNTLKNGIGVMPCDLLIPDSENRFHPWPDYGEESNRSMMWKMLDKLEALGSDVYILDCSVTGFPAVQIYAAGISEAMQPDWLTVSIMKYLRKAQYILTHLDQADDRDIKTLSAAQSLKRSVTVSRDRSISRALTIPFRFQPPGGALHTLFLKGLCEYRLGNLETACQLIQNTVDIAKLEDGGVYEKAVALYLQGLVNQYSREQIRTVLSALFPKVCDKVMSDLEDPKSVLQKVYPVCNGMRCDTCPGETKARCCYPAVREATRIIWKQFNQNLPSDEIICRKFERP